MVENGRARARHHIFFKKARKTLCPGIEGSSLSLINPLKNSNLFGLGWHLIWLHQTTIHHYGQNCPRPYLEIGSSMFPISRYGRGQFLKVKFLKVDVKYFLLTTSFMVRLQPTTTVFQFQIKMWMVEHNIKTWTYL